MWFVLQELEFKICYSSIHLLWGITKTYSLISEALWPIGWWTQAISTLHTFFSSAYNFFHSLFALSSIIVSQPNFILHTSCRKIFAVKTNSDTNINTSNIQATFFNTVLFVTSLLSNVNDSNVKLIPSILLYHY